MLWNGHNMPTTGQNKSRIGPVIRVAAGNFLEMYDFMVFGYYAAAIGRTFFPRGSEFASLMNALMTFGAGYIMRPLGGIVLGAHRRHRPAADSSRPPRPGTLGGRRSGRRLGLLVGDRHTRPEGILLRLPVRQPAGGRYARRPDRHRAQRLRQPRGHGGVGMARAAADRLRHRAVPLCSAPLAGRNG